MKINVGVFYGGNSVEHEISVISASQVMHALNKEKYNVIPIYIGKNSQMYTGQDLLNIENYQDTEKLLNACDKIAIARNDNDICGIRIPPKKLSNNILFKIDIALPIVHGTNCEDGTIQGYLELLRIPYVGSDVFASSIGMDKIATKIILKHNNIPVLDYLAYHSKEWHNDSDSILKEIEEVIGYPVILKPANLGSSVGIKKAVNRDELEDAIELALSFSDRIIVEKAIVKLKEVNCSVIGDYDNAYPSVCEEPISDDEILSYQNKYMSKNSSKGMDSLKRKLPADITQEMDKYIKELAVSIFKTIRCNGIVRIDFLVDLENNNKVYANEINTIPGSLAFYLWEAVDKPFDVLLDESINLAFRREREKQKIVYTYDTNIFSLKGTQGVKGSKA